MKRKCTSGEIYQISQVVFLIKFHTPRSKKLSAIKTLHLHRLSSLDRKCAKRDTFCRPSLPVLTVSVVTIVIV